VQDISKELAKAQNTLFDMMENEDDEKDLVFVAEWFAASGIQETPTEAIGEMIETCLNFKPTSDDQLIQLWHTLLSLRMKRRFDVKHFGNCDYFLNCMDDAYRYLDKLIFL
jgi:monoamine oxidase